MEPWDCSIGKKLKTQLKKEWRHLSAIRIWIKICNCHWERHDCGVCGVFYGLYINHYLHLNLKVILFWSGRFRDAPNNQRMASVFPCVDPISTGTWWIDQLTRLAFTAISGVTPRIVWCNTYSGFVYVFCWILFIAR